MPFTSNMFSGLKHMNTISLKGLVLKCYFKFQRKEMEFFHSKWVPPGISNLFPISVNICSNWRPGWREQPFPTALAHQSIIHIGDNQYICKCYECRCRAGLFLDKTQDRR